MRVVVLVFCLLLPALACASFYPSEFPTALTAEQALIIWDKETKTEHFIRKANFSTASPTLGFVVPTPTQPTLAEISDSIFPELDALTKPKIVYEERRVYMFGSLFLSRAGDGTAPVSATPAVQVFEEGQVAGQEYAVLQADNPEALAEWLKANDFPFSEKNKIWASYYLEKGYFLTAFKYSGEGRDIQSQAVRMTFQSDKPWYPYQEPEVETEPSFRQLRLYLLTDSRMQGRLEDKDWAAELKFSAPTSGLPEGITELTKARHLNAFDDFTKNRNGLPDLSFDVSSDQADLVPESKIITKRVPVTIPIELIFLGMVCLMSVMLVIRGRAK